jgi:hypothetical protein
MHPPAVVHNMQIVVLCDHSSLEDKETCQYNNQKHGCARMVMGADENGAALRGMHKPRKRRVAQ